MSGLSVRVSPDVQIPNPYLLVRALMQAPHTSIPEGTTSAVVVSFWKTDGAKCGYKVSCYRDHVLIGSFKLEDPYGHHSGPSRHHSARRSSSKAAPAKASPRASSSRAVSKPPPTTRNQAEFWFGPLVYEERRTDTKQTNSARQNSEWVKYSQDGRVRTVVRMDVQSTRERLLDDGQRASRRPRNDDWLDMGPVGQAMGMFYGMMAGNEQHIQPLFTGSRNSRRVIEDVGSDTGWERAVSERTASDKKKERDEERERERQEEEKRRKKAHKEEEEKKKKEEEEEKKKRKKIEEEEAKREEERRTKKAEAKKQKEEEKKKREEGRKVKDEEKKQRKEERRVERERRAAVRREREERRNRSCACESCERERNRSCDCARCERKRIRQSDSTKATKGSDEDKKSDEDSKTKKNKGNDGWGSPPRAADDKATADKEKEDEAAQRARRRAKNRDAVPFKKSWAESTRGKDTDKGKVPEGQGQW